MDELARSIGWWVIIGTGIYIVGKLIIAHGDEQQRKKEMIFSIADHERRLEYRRVWQLTTDPRIRAEIKFQYGPWVLLDLDLSDDEYARKNCFSDAYQQAKSNIERDGYSIEIVAGKIVHRPLS